MAQNSQNRLILIAAGALLLTAALAAIVFSFRGYKTPIEKEGEGRQERASTAGSPACEPYYYGPRPPSLPMDRANTGRTANYESAAVSSFNELKWQFRRVTPDLPSFSSPVVAGDTVFVAGEVYNEETGIDTNSGLYAIDAETGKEKWSHIIDISYYPSFPPSAPTVAGGIVYYGTLESNMLYAVNAETGQELWTFPLGLHGAVVASPLVVDGTVYLPGGDLDFYAIDATAGTEKWRFTTSMANMGAAALDGGLVYFGSADGNLYALDAATGAERWHFTTNGPVDAAPSIENGTVFVTSADSYLYALDAATGEEKWRYQTGIRESQPVAVAADMVFLAAGAESSSGNAMVALRTADSSEVWRFESDGFFSPPSVASGAVYFSTNRFFYAVDTFSGSGCWSFDAELDLTSAAAADSVIYLTDFNGTVYALE